MVTDGVRRAGLAAVLGGLAALLLSGCFTLAMDLEIAPDDTVDGSIVLAVDNSLVDSAGGQDELVESLTSGDSALFNERPASGEISTQTYTDGERSGVEYTLSGVPLSEFGASTDGDLSIARVADTYVVQGALDLSEGLADSSQGTMALLETADVTLSVSFPGEVLKSNGQVSGNTVTWSPEAGQVLGVEATGRVSASGPGALTVGIGLLFLFVVVAAALWLALRPR